MRRPAARRAPRFVVRWVIAGAVRSRVMLGIIDFFVSTVVRGRANRKQARKEAALRKRGVLAPAVVVSAHTRAKRSSVDGEFIRIDYTVDVHPDGAEPFRAEFRHWSERRGYTAIRNEIVGEAGRHIWVTYDPDDPDDMIFEYHEEERVAIEREADLEFRRGQFNVLLESVAPLREHGVPAEATIVGVDDPDLPYPRLESTGLHLHVDVVGPGIGPRRVVMPALIGFVALDKYSAGRRVFVRVDPDDHDRVVLDSERNRLLPN